LPKKARGDDSKIEENSNNGDQATQWTVRLTPDVKYQYYQVICENWNTYPHHSWIANSGYLFKNRLS
jgi:hypothetical protein